MEIRTMYQAPELFVLGPCAQLTHGCADYVLIDNLTGLFRIHAF
jgi:hypothetical protein